VIDRTNKLTPHFRLGELVPKDCAEVPPWILGELSDLCAELLEPVRAKFGPLVIHDAYRPSELNERVGGVTSSDHLNGRAADFHVTGNLDRAWQEQTVEAFHWIREHLQGRFGQLILEDHRKALGDQGKLWVHISMPSAKHPGTSSDTNAVLVSTEPKRYMALTEWTDQEPVTGTG
jgi:hypothetical protein